MQGTYNPTDVYIEGRFRQQQRVEYMVVGCYLEIPLLLALQLSICIGNNFPRTDMHGGPCSSAALLLHSACSLLAKLHRNVAVCAVN